MSRILIVEDDAALRATLIFHLGRDEHDVTATSSGEEALERCRREGAPDLALVDVRLGGMSGIELVTRLRALGIEPMTIVMSGEASLSEAVEAVRLGVHDFLEKPFSGDRLRLSVENALRHRKLHHELQGLRESVASEVALIGESPPMLELRRAVDRAAATDVRVLIQGESGTGKELVAELLHRRGGRANGPFVKINCAALAPNLVEGELFGHARGAFTDAHRDKPGLFEAAHRGTLLLDEIGDMDSSLQARLLRVLEDGRVRRVGENRDREVDVRVIASTNRRLEQEVAGGSFRQDLYYRLAQLPIDVPPLRVRGGDVRLLYERFLRLASLRHRRPAPTTDSGVFSLLDAHPWPGNVRELKNLCERLVVFGSDPVRVDDLPSAFGGAESSAEIGLVRVPESARPLSLKEFRQQCEREYVEAILIRSGWNYATAARTLGLQRSYLYEKARELGLRR